MKKGVRDWAWFLLSFVGGLLVCGALLLLILFSLIRLLHDDGSSDGFPGCAAVETETSGVSGR